MWHMRPGTRIQLWSPKFKNKPFVEPPGLLRLLSGLSIVSVVGVLIYAVALSLDGVWSTTRGQESAAYIAFLHFILPLCVAYTVSTNSWLSRPLVAVYFTSLYGATVLGKGYLGGLEFDPTLKAVAVTIFFALVMAWLFRSPKMRIYYALLAGNPIPPELESRAHELATKSTLSPRVTAAVDWVAEHLETVVMLGFIIVVLYAWASTG